MDLKVFFGEDIFLITWLISTVYVGRPGREPRAAPTVSTVLAALGSAQIVISSSDCWLRAGRAFNGFVPTWFSAILLVCCTGGRRGGQCARKWRKPSSGAGTETSVWSVYGDISGDHEMGTRLYEGLKSYIRDLDSHLFFKASQQQRFILSSVNKIDINKTNSGFASPCLGYDS